MMVNVVWFSLLLCLVTAQYDQTSFIFQDGTEFTLTASSDPVVVSDCPCTGEPDCCRGIKNPSQTVDEPDSVDQDPDDWWASTRCLIYSKHQPNLTLCTSCPFFTMLNYGDCSIDSFHVKATCSLFSDPNVTVYFDSMSLDIPNMGETIHLKFCKKSESTTQKVDSTARETFTNPIGRGQDSPPNRVYTSTTTTTQTVISTSEPDISTTDSSHEKQPTTSLRLNPSTRPDLSTTMTPRPRQSSTNEHVASTESNPSTTGETNQTISKAGTNPNQSSGDDVPVPLIIGLVLGVALIIAVTAVIIALLRPKKERPREENSAVHAGSAFNGPHCVMSVNIMNCDHFGEVGGADPPPDYFQTVQSSGAQQKRSNTCNK